MQELGCEGQRPGLGKRAFCDMYLLCVIIIIIVLTGLMLRGYSPYFYLPVRVRGQRCISFRCTAQWWTRHGLYEWVSPPLVGLVPTWHRTRLLRCDRLCSLCWTLHLRDCSCQCQFVLLRPATFFPEPQTPARSATISSLCLFLFGWFIFLFFDSMCKRNHMVFAFP